MFSRRDKRAEDGERGERGGAPTGGGYADIGLLEVIARLDALGTAVRALGDDVERHEEDIRDLLAAAAGSGSGDVLDEARRRALDVAEDLQHVWLRAWRAGGERGAGRAVGSPREQARGVGELLRRVLGGEGAASGAAGADRGSVEADGVALRGAAVEAGVEFSWDAVPPGRADGQSGTSSGAGSSASSGAGSGTPSGAGPSAPSGAGPGTPSGAGPGTPSGAGPSAPSGAGPGTPSGAGPGTPSGAGPGTPSGAGPGTPSGAGPGTPSGAGSGSELWPGCAAGDPVLFVVRPAVVHRGQRVAPAMVFTGVVERDGVERDGVERDGVERDGVESGVGRGSAGVRAGEPSVVRGRGRWAWRVREHRERHGQDSGGAS
ncbi:hypothetical protein JGB26_02835 [Streptomyces flavofungini]|uniref:Uncharacterized protein n=1 Tax=Streptomyces flavofungini TaxID=68200 RepID=A0ABS0WYR8_9ACTN|nr:hypothetical protein [Streptomyces flavofungini]MBJ3806066.1 hypothetical protein [Streptomyces flavofungini]